MEDVLRIVKLVPAVGVSFASAEWAEPIMTSFALVVFAEPDEGDTDDPKAEEVASSAFVVAAPEYSTRWDEYVTFEEGVIVMVVAPAATFMA